MAKDVRIVINLAKSVTGAGFGYPLIFQGKATTAVPYTECADIDEVIKAVGGITAEDDESAIATKTATAKESPIYKAALLMLMQDTAPEKIAVYASKDVATTAIAGILHLGWRQLVVVSAGTEGEDTLKAISDYIETTGKMFFVSVKDKAALTAASLSENDRTVVLVHEDDDATVVFPEAALVGATAGKAAGSITYMHKALKGLTPKVMTTAEINAIHELNGIAFVLASGDGVTSEGICASGEYVDIIDSKDYIIQNMEYRIEKLLHSVDKLKYDNAGISRIENVCYDVLKDAANNGIIALTDEGVPDFSVSFKVRNDTKAADRAARRYVEGSFRFALAGAIHSVEIVGTIEI